jgi:hypothetical protein
MKKSHHIFLNKHGWLFLTCCVLLIVLGVMILRIPHWTGNDSREALLLSRINKQLQICCTSEVDRSERSEEEFEQRIIDYGGRTGELTISLLWNTMDDLDLAVITPNSSDTVYYKRPRHDSGGALDVDKNRQDTRLVINPVENIRWLSNPPKGKYRICVSLFSLRTNQIGAVPFQIQVKKGDQRSFYNGEISFSDQSFEDQKIDLYVD